MLYIAFRTTPHKHGSLVLQDMQHSLLAESQAALCCPAHQLQASGFLACTPFFHSLYPSEQLFVHLLVRTQFR